MSTRLEEMRGQCEAFHARHPEVWELFEKFTFDRIRRGFTHYSVNAIFERIRWEADRVGGDGKAEFKLNNNYRPFYARRFMRKYPQYGQFFRIRAQTSQSAPATRRPELTPPQHEIAAAL